MQLMQINTSSQPVADPSHEHFYDESFRDEPSEDKPPEDEPPKSSVIDLGTLDEMFISVVCMYIIWSRTPFFYNMETPKLNQLSTNSRKRRGNDA